MTIRNLTITPIVLLLLVIVSIAQADDDQARALANGERHAEGLRRCQRYLEGWLEHADAKSGLLPIYITRGNSQYWDAANSAADNFPFMVLTASITDRERFAGTMHDILEAEIRLTSRIGAMPDTFDFKTQAFRNRNVDLASVIFGSSEYVKDGLMPITEWLGESPWSDRMIAIIDEMWRNAPIDTPAGPIVSDNVEVNGEMLQVMSRLYWMTGDAKYLDWLRRVGDYYLLGDKHPIRDLSRLKLRDHGCEIVSGLCEMYVTFHFADPQRKETYRQAIHEMVQRTLEVGRNEHGLFYDAVNPITGEVLAHRAADTWGYTLNGIYAIYLIDGNEPYRDAVLKALNAINEHYRDFDWERGTSDGYADTIESALNLYNREQVGAAATWIDDEIQKMWKLQKSNGLIEGWYSDGNFARTTIMYCLWKSQGAAVQPWRQDVELGAVQTSSGEVLLTLRADEPWTGRVVFDSARHATQLGLPIDWPRINQMPEWFTADEAKRYEVQIGDETQTLGGAQLIQGVEVQLQADTVLTLRVR